MVYNIEIDFDTGKILEITITKYKNILGLGENKIKLSWDKIEKIGGEVIIVNYN